MLSLLRAESPGGQRAGVGTLSDLFRLLVRSWVFLLVVCDSRSPCACFKPMWSVRGCQGTTFYHFLELSHKKGLRMPYCEFTVQSGDQKITRLVYSADIHKPP